MTPAEAENERRCLAEVYSWCPEFPSEKFLTTLASSIAIKILEDSLTTKRRAFFKSFAFGRQALALAESKLHDALVHYDEAAASSMTSTEPPRGLFQPLRRLITSRRNQGRTQKSRTAFAGADPPGHARGRPPAKRAALDTPYKDNFNIVSIPQISTDDNGAFELLIDEPWSGDIVALAPFTLLMRHARGAPWCVVEVSAEHAAWLETIGDA